MSLPVPDQASRIELGEAILFFYRAGYLGHLACDKMLHGIESECRRCWAACHVRQA